MKIYTVIPKALGQISTWSKKIPHAFSKTTGVILLQPITKEGPSMSPYAADDYFKINKDIADSIDEVIETGLKHDVGIGVDLVYNHAAIDGEIVNKHLDWIKRNKDGSLRLGQGGGEIWHDIVQWNYLHEEAQEMAIEYARMWARIPYETNGIIRFDNIKESHVPTTKKILNMLNKEFPGIHTTGEYFGHKGKRQQFTEAGIDSYLSMALFKQTCPEMAEYLREMHKSNVPHFTPISTHDSKGPEEVFGIVQSWIPRYAVSALMNDSEYYGITMWDEHGHPNKIPFIGENIPSKPQKRMNFENYFSAIDERAKDFTGEIKITNNECIIHAQRNGHDVFVNFDINKSREFEGITLPPHSVLVDDTLFYEQNGEIKNT